MMMIVVAVYAVVLGVMVVRLYNALCVYRRSVEVGCNHGHLSRARQAVRPVDEKFDVFDTATNETMIGGFTTGWNAQQNADARNNELTMTGRIVPPFNLQE